MNWISSLDIIKDTISAIGDNVDKVFTSDEEKLQLRNDAKKIAADLEIFKQTYGLQIIENRKQLNLAQLEVTKEELRTGNVFISGARPFILWTGGLSLFYQFLIYPILSIIIEMPEPLNSDMLYTLIVGLLGVGGMRSLEKIKNVDTKGIR